MQTHKLIYPIEADGQTVEELHIRRPKVRDLRTMDQEQGDIAQSVRLISTLTDLSPAQVGELDAADFSAISEIIAGFFPEGSIGKRP